MRVGGAETLLKEAIIELNKKHPHIEQFLVTIYEEGALYKEVMPFTTQCNLGATKASFFLKLFELREFILKNNIDIVHAHLYEAMILSRLAIPKRIKLFQTYHSSMYNPRLIYYSKKRLWLDRLTSKKRFRSIFISNTVKEEICMAIPNSRNGIVIYNFNANRFTPLYEFKPEKSIRLISTGNLLSQKNHDFSIKTLSKLKHLDINLDIYGHGELEAPLLSLIKNTGARVRIINDQIMTSEILSRYDAFLMASSMEGMSIALLEAMRTGLPSILSDIPSFRETAGNAALYFDLKSEYNLAKILTNILADKKILESFSESAKKISSNYSIDKFIEKLIKEYTN